MAISSDFYMHDSDRMALQALKAVPGFSQVVKAIMSVWDEKLFYIENMSCNLRISENQMSKYHKMLAPICEKLGIDIPELYITLDVEANAYTAGDTKPFIVMTSGLIETMPDDLIATVLAHECGHIACHHCLYTTIGRFIRDETVKFLKLDGIALLPIQAAYAYWKRCSELSADRAAAICEGTPDKVVEMCMRFAGYDKDIDADANVEEFLNQALEYQKLVNEGRLNKAMEFYMFFHVDHPLNAVRAYECNEWAKTKRFQKICNYLGAEANSENNSIGAYLEEIPMVEASKTYVGKNYNDVECEFEEMGFANVKVAKNTQKGLMVKEGQVLGIRVNGKAGFEMCEWLPLDAEIIIDFYEPETDEEVAAAHPGQRRAPDTSKRYLGRLYQDVAEEFQNAGFSSIILDEVRKDKKGWFDKEGAISSISINGQAQFEKNEWFDEKAVVKITYSTYIGKADS